ncbi:WxL domain-containing protein [Pseudolactococcus reticulitermitis]|uniref:WxL domain-containing protein n=1 Tax=Pseudolactococcus reticulitermitis TaxID=2025039 RepID=A0A224XDK9_9LACT|nr:WxL domain-containing protein [Lactococcus reticulitermitis]GAX47992.1 hypothetical protein RsY01_1606 [Lactococcus reticulitermitis]
MKTIKLLSALALTLATATAVSTVASAETTNSSVELLTDTGNGATMILPTDPEKLGTDLPGTIYPSGQKPDITDPSVVKGKEIVTNTTYPNTVVPGYAGDLYFSLIPKQFNFGAHKVNAADQQKGVTYKQESAQPFSHVQAVEVHDGRVSTGDDWHVAADLGALPNIKGATITFRNTKVNTEYTGGAIRLGKDHNVTAKTFTLTEGAGAKNFLSAGTQSKGDSSAYWRDINDLEISIPAGSLKVGTHTADVTWTLTNTPEV